MPYSTPQAVPAPGSGPRRGGPARPVAPAPQPLFSDIGQGDFLHNVAHLTDNPLLRCVPLPSPPPIGLRLTFICMCGLRVGLDQGSRWAEDAGRKGLEGVLAPSLPQSLGSGHVVLTHALVLLVEQITRYLEATNLKYYFNINNSYVPNKLKVILCPILHKVHTLTHTPAVFVWYGDP